MVVKFPVVECLYNLATTDNIKMSLFEVDFDRNPKSPLYFIIGIYVMVHSVNKLKKRLKAPLNNGN